MASKIRYLWKNLIDLDNTELTESSQVDTLPVKNLQYPFRTLVWRTAELINNPLLNPGFEEGTIGQPPPNWGKYYDGNGGSTFLTESVSSEGDKGAQLIIGGTDTYVGGYQDYELGTLIKKGQRYLLKAKFKCTSSCNVDLRLTEHTGGTARARNYAFNLPGGAEWVEKQIDLVVEDGDNTKLRNMFICKTTGAVLYVDDVRLYRYESVIIDLAQACSVKSFALVNHNLQSGADILLMGNDFNSWEGTLGSDPGTGLPVREELSYDGDILIKYFPEASYRYWRFEALDPTNPDEYLEFGRISLSAYFEPSRNFVYGWEYGLVDPTEIDESEGGQEFMNVKEQYRLIRVAFTEGAPLSDADKQGYETIFNYCGVNRCLFISLDYENKPNKWSFYGRFASTPFNFREFEKGYFSTGFDFKEAR